MLDEAQKLHIYKIYLGLRQDAVKVEEINTRDLTADQYDRQQRLLNEVREAMWEAEELASEQPLMIDSELFEQGRSAGALFAVGECELVRTFLLRMKMDSHHAFDFYEELLKWVPDLESRGYSYVRGFADGAREVVAVG